MPDSPPSVEISADNQGLGSTDALIVRALNRLDAGISVFDRDFRLVMFNQTFLDLYGLSADAVAIGMSVEQLAQRARPASQRLSADIDALLAECARRGPDCKDCSLQRLSADGRMLEITSHPLPIGGFVATCKDVTEQRQAERRLDDAVHGLAEGFMLWDADDRLVMCNRKIFSVYPGLDDILVPGRRFEDNVREAIRRKVIVLPDQVDPEQWIEKRLAQHRNPAAPIERLTGDGRWLRIIEHRTADDGIVGIVVDITDLKNAEQALRQSEERLQLAVTGTKEGLWDWDIVADKIWYSPAWWRLIGLDASAIETYLWRDHIDPRDLHRVQADIADLFTGKTGGFHSIHRHRHGDGHWLWIEAQGTCVRDANGDPVRFIGRFSNVTKRKSAEEALRKSEASLANAQRIARIGNWDLKVTSNELAWSDEIYRIFGMPPKAFPATYDDLLAVVHPDDRQRLREAVDAALYRDRPYGVEHRIIRPDGEQRIVRQEGEVIFDDGGTPVRMTGTVQDITEDKQAEQALREIEERFRLAFEMCPDAMTITRLDDGRLVDVNDGFTALCGYSRDQAVGKRSADLGFWDDPGERRRLAAEVRENGRLSNVEIRVRHKDGAIRTALLSASVFKLNGEPHLLAIARDIGELKRAAEELRKLSRAVEQGPAAVLITDTDGIIEYVNPKFTEITGYSREEVVGHNPRLLKSGEVSGQQYRELWATLTKGGEWRGELRNRRKDGALYWASASISPIKAPSGEITHYIGIQTDITEAKQAAERLRASEERFRCLVESSVLGIVIDRHGVPLFCNQTYATVFGYDHPAEILALGSLDPLYANTHLERVKRYREARIEGEQAPDEYEFQGVRKDGSSIWVRTQLNLIPWNGETAVQSTVVDITLRKHYEQRLHYQANFDAVTDLPNRSLALDRLNRAVAGARRHFRKVGLLFVDLDHFKKINDTMGHALGDRFLKEAGQRIKSCVRQEDTVARLGGDEFTVILPDIKSAEDTEAVARKIIESISRPLVLDGNEAFIGASVGITICPDDGTEAEALMRNADAAMYLAKEQGRNTSRFFTPVLNERTQERLQLEARLRYALEREQFVLHYQPLIDIRSGRITGAEALLRWQSPDLGLVSPDRFIRLAEDTGMIVPIGEWVLANACRQARAWQDEASGRFRLSVNVSSRQFKGRTLVDAVTHALQSNGLAHDCLELEITEGLLMDDLPDTQDSIVELEASGIRLAIDDFGTGYSSLRYLNRFPLDTLKIDRSFIHDVPADPAYAALVEAIIAMAHRLELRVIAEGVETREQLDFLRARGCDVAQGHYFSPAVAAEAFGTLLRKWQRAPRQAV